MIFTPFQSNTYLSKNFCSFSVTKDSCHLRKTIQSSSCIRFSKFYFDFNSRLDQLIRLFHNFRWVKIGTIRHFSFISKDVICYATGCFIKFLNIHTNDELKLDVNFPSVNGDGVGVLEGHRSIYVFCYAENCRYPSMYIKNYPAFKTIVKIPGKIKIRPFPALCL